MQNNVPFFFTSKKAKTSLVWGLLIALRLYKRLFTEFSLCIPVTIQMWRNDGTFLFVLVVFTIGFSKCGHFLEALCKDAIIFWQSVKTMQTKNTVSDTCKTNRMKLPVRLQILYIHAKFSVETKSKTSAKKKFAFPANVNKLLRNFIFLYNSSDYLQKRIALFLPRFALAVKI